MIKPYYEEKDIKIYLGDCRDILPHLEPVDLVLTDVPYGIGKDEWDTEYPEWCVDLFFSISSSVCVMPGLWAINKCIKSFGERYKWIIAGRNINGMTHGRIGFSNWIPAVVGGEVKHGGQDAFDFSIGFEKQFKHPDQKPLTFMRFCVKRLTEDFDIVLDPFMGSGTTLRAAKDLGRRAIGIEIEEKYCDIAIERLRQGVLL